MSVILCPHCGTSNRIGSNFCNACGVDLRGDDEPRPPDSTPREPERSSSPTEPSLTAAAPIEPESREAGPGESESYDDRSPLPAEAGADSDSVGDDEERDGEEDIPDESVIDPVTDPLIGAQPWLNYGFDEGFDPESDEELEDPDGEPAAERPGPRFVTGIQGLLDPIRISPRLSETRQPLPALPGSGAGVRSEAGSSEALRRFRALLYEDPRPASTVRRSPAVSTQARMYIPWLFILVAVIVGVPVALGLGGGENLPPEWPGVAEAHAAIQNVPADGVVLVYWAYDPATAGELDLAARPVVRHLLDRRARLMGVSPLPAGPATARRVVEEIRRDREQTGLFSGAAHNPWPVTVSYLPGGVGALPLMATRPAAAIGPVLDEAAARAPALALVLGAQAEDVQHWLEQVHARNRVPVVAVVSAGADPSLRPYLDSGQLRGLVSGFDGAFHYQARLDPQTSRSDGVAIRTHAGAQNWAHLAIFAALILGNLAAMIGQSGRA